MVKKIIKFFIFILIVIIIALAVIGWYGHGYYEKTIAKTPIETKVKEIREEYTFVKSDNIPENYFKAVVAVEDKRYYNHGAADIFGIGRAIVVNTKNKELQEGGSTITQQVAKNMYFIDDDSDVVKRKVAEMFTAMELEKKYSKDEILELYANIIYFGNGYYGINEACQGYLHKDPKDMNLAECTMMAGIPNAPSVYAPTVNKDLCKKRQQKVISSMVDNGDITKELAEKIDSSFIDEI
ncbi:MAG: transglycosylase domain-containing protein [Clostridia bacterium]|nr:transglycosylase domain-containing protein [Clostridia bacterium]